jgi:hypothetical protein
VSHVTSLGSVGYAHSSTFRVLVPPPHFSNLCGEFELNITLRLDLNGLGSPTPTVHFHRLTRNYTKDATWATYDGAHNWTTAGGDFVATESVAISLTNYTFDVSFNSGGLVRRCYAHTRHVLIMHTW